MLKSCKFPGVYAIPSARSPLIWFGVMFIREGPYEGAVFRFNLEIPETFPDGGCPKLIFKTTVFHPLVRPHSGELDLSHAFMEWNKNRNHIWQIMDFAIRCFAKVNTQNPANAEAARLCEDNPEQFSQAVDDCVRNSQRRVYDPPPTDDPHYFCFEPYNSAIHDPFKQKLLNPDSIEEDTVEQSGLSWVLPGSLKPFSRPFSNPKAMPDSL